jgi:hypothetical protein
MILDKFIKDFAKGNKNITKIIEDIVLNYFSNDKITEDSLRVLKQTVSKAVEDYRKDNKSCISFFIKKKVSSQPLLNSKFSRETLNKNEVKLLLKDQYLRVKNNFHNLIKILSDQVGHQRPGI